MKSQEIIPLYDQFHMKMEVGKYYKDVNNYQNQFDGTWIYTSGTTSLTFKIRKITKHHISDQYHNYFMDILVGEYQYIENGVQKSNSLNNFDQTFADYYMYNLSSSHLLLITRSIPPVCTDCSELEKRLFFAFFENQITDEYQDSATVGARVVTENNQVKLKINFGKRFSWGPGHGFSIPYGNYTLIKQ